MVRIIKTNQNLYREEEEYEYTPTPAELHFYYSGTNAGLDRNNPYARRYGMTVTKHRYVLANPEPERSK